MQSRAVYPPGSLFLHGNPPSPAMEGAGTVVMNILKLLFEGMEIRVPSVHK
jgi:hypothetical protein